MRRAAGAPRDMLPHTTLSASPPVATTRDTQQLYFVHVSSHLRRVSISNGKACGLQWLVSVTTCPESLKLCGLFATHGGTPTLDLPRSVWARHTQMRAGAVRVNCTVNRGSGTESNGMRMTRRLAIREAETPENSAGTAGVVGIH